MEYFSSSLQDKRSVQDMEPGEKPITSLHKSKNQVREVPTFVSYKWIAVIVTFPLQQSDITLPPNLAPANK